MFSYQKPMSRERIYPPRVLNQIILIAMSRTILEMNFETYISKVDEVEAPPVPAVFESQRS